MNVEKIDNGIYRFLIPFEGEIDTTVYAVADEDGVALIDAATYPSDADKYVLPALSQIGFSPADVRALLLSHDHGDHAGGAARLLECLPNAVLRAPFAWDSPRFAPLCDGDRPLGRLLALHLAGHTPHSFGFLDLPTKTLLSGDCLQLFGVGKYRNGIALPGDYQASVERLLRTDLLRIVAAHEYDPLGSVAEGRAAVERYLTTCLKALPQK